MFAVSMRASTEVRIGLGLKSLPTPTSALPPTPAVTVMSLTCQPPASLLMEKE